MSIRSQLPRLKFIHVAKGFPGDLEKDYYEDFFRTSLLIVRVALILGIALYSLFGILDIWVVPLNKKAVWIIRYAVVCPMLGAAFVLTYFDIFKKYMQITLSAVGFSAGFGIVLMIGFSAESELGFKFYYAGLMLVLMWIYALVRLRFIYATLVSWVITVSYEIVALGINKLLSTPDNVTVFINNNFFFISANIIGMFASFTIEWYMRKNYLLRMEIERSYNLNRKYLENIREGLLLIDDSYTILNQYSSYLPVMFSRDEIEGINFIDLVMPDRENMKQERADLERFLKFLFHNKSADIDMIMDLNPFVNRKIYVSNGSAVKELIINADFIRIQDRDSVEFVMAIFQDMTDIMKFEKQLDDQKSKHLQEVETVTAILRSGPKLFSDFLKESEEILDDIRTKSSDLSSIETLNHVFREAHSLKGSAKHLELNHISTTAHAIEDIMAEIRDSSGSGAAGKKSEINRLISELFKDFDELGKLIEKLSMFSHLGKGSSAESHENPLNDFIESLYTMVDNLAKELDKDVKLVIDNKLTDIPFLAKLKNPLIHLIRNSLDHGIEDKFERLTSGKDQTGTVSIILNEDAGKYYFEISDDGAGIDFDAVWKKAESLGLVPDGEKPERSALVKLLFTPSFSSKNKVTEISGRGYGLDIVKVAVESLGGQISVKTARGKGSRLIISIPKNNS